MAGEADDLRKLSRQLDDVPSNLGEPLFRAIEGTSMGVKKDWTAALNAAAGATKPHRLRGVGESVDFDIRAIGGGGVAGALGLSRGVESEIGPNLGRGQGPMAGWFEEGSVDGVPGVKPGERAMKANEADFERGIDNAVRDAMKAAGLL